MRTHHALALVSRVRARADALLAAELASRGVEGMAPSHGHVLTALLESGPLPMSRIAEHIGRKKNTVTTLVAKLEHTGYVETVADPVDGRVTLVSLTPRGEGLREEFREMNRALLRRAFGTMAKAEREALVRGLEQLAANLS